MRYFHGGCGWEGKERLMLVFLVIAAVKAFYLAILIWGNRMKIMGAVNNHYVVSRAYLMLACVWVLSHAYAGIIIRLGLSMRVCPLVMFVIDDPSLVSPLYSFSYADFGFLACIDHHVG